MIHASGALELSTPRYYVFVFNLFYIYLFLIVYIYLCNESDAFLTALCNYTLGGNVKVPVDSRKSIQTRIFLISYQYVKIHSHSIHLCMAISISSATPATSSLLSNATNTLTSMLMPAPASLNTNNNTNNDNNANMTVIAGLSSNQAHRCVYFTCVMFLINILMLNVVCFEFHLLICCCFDIQTIL